MTTRRTESWFGVVGTAIGEVLGAAAVLVGAWVWFYVLAVAVQAPGGLSELSMPFFTISLVLWILFWGAALVMTAAVSVGRAKSHAWPSG